MGIPDVVRSRVTEPVRRMGCTPAEAAALAILAVGALAGLALVWQAAGTGAAADGVPSPPLLLASEMAAPSDGGGAAGPKEVAETAPGVIVHVAGEVRQPGLYTLPAGARVADAVTAAGGARRRAVLGAVNLARLLVDGEQVVVPGADGPASTTAAAPPPPTSPGVPTPAALVNLNLATVAELEELPGIGPVLAERIIQHRDSIGGFTEVGQLRDVPGIGEKTFQALAALVSS